MRSTGLHSPARHRPGLAPGFVHLAVSVLGMGSPACRRQGLCLAAGWMPSAVRRVAARRGLLSRCVSVHEAMTRTRATRGRPSFQKTGVDCGIGRSERISPRKKTGTPHTNQPLRTLLLLCYLSWNPCGQPVEKVWNVSASGSAAACRSGEGGSNLCRSKTGNRPLGGFLWGRKTTPPRGFVSHGGSTDTPHDRPQVPAIVHGFSTCGRPSLPGACLRSSLESAREETPGRTTTRRGAQAPALSNPVQPATPGHVGEPGEHLASAGPLPLLDVLGAGQPRPPRLLATSASWASTWPTPARCRCWTCSAPGSPTPATAGRVGEPGEHLADAGPLPGLVPWPSSWCSPAAVDRRPRPAAAAGRARRRATPTPATAGHVRELGEHLADAGPLPLLDVPGAGQPRPLRPQHQSGRVGGTGRPR